MVFAADKGIPVSLSHHYPGLTTGSNHMHLQQSLLARANSANPNFPFSGSHAQYQPGYLAAGEHGTNEHVSSMGERPTSAAIRALWLPIWQLVDFSQCPSLPTDITR
ncbi:hypothetical protein NQZ68_036574 [Dissostichus eleginoides]|nr:hypothetical protein NQZ68_036574 [Dissostichus eleginoides]